MRYLIFLSIFVIGLFSSAVSRAGWQEEWERTVKAAKKEGKVSMFGPTGTARRDALVRPFEKKFGITVEYLGGRVTTFPPRIAAERGYNTGWVDYVLNARLLMSIPTNVSYVHQPKKNLLSYQW